MSTIVSLVTLCHPKCDVSRTFLSKSSGYQLRFSVNGLDDHVVRLTKDMDSRYLTGEKQWLGELNHGIDLASSCGIAVQRHLPYGPTKPRVIMLAVVVPKGYEEGTVRLVGTGLVHSSFGNATETAISTLAIPDEVSELAAIGRGGLFGATLIGEAKRLISEKQAETEDKEEEINE